MQPYQLRRLCRPCELLLCLMRKVQGAPDDLVRVELPDDGELLVCSSD